MSHRIAFAGASGTGKTTLARMVANQLGLPLAPSAARAAAEEMGLLSPYEADRCGRRDELQRLIVAKRINWQNLHGFESEVGFVSDRSSYDDLAYTLIHCGEPLYAELLTPVFNQDQVLDPTYTRVVFCPMASFFHLGTDPVRNPDVAYHREFERLLLTLLDKARVTFDLSICRVAVEQRPFWVSEFCNEVRRG